MKVIFVKDVPKVASAGEIKEVADGYGRNFLIPQKLAVLVSPAATSTIETQRRKKDQTGTEFGELADQLEGKEIILKARAGAKERLHGSVTSADIASELQKSTGVVVDKRKIELAEPIHHLGSYEVAVRLAKDIVPKIKVTVTEEVEPEAKPKTKAKAKKDEADEADVKVKPKAKAKAKTKTKTKKDKEKETKAEVEATETKAKTKTKTKTKTKKDKEKETD